MDDIIAAISTALGAGGISIIRVSGKGSISIVNGLFSGRDLEKVDSHTINYGHIVYDGEIIDEVLVSIMRAPKTYTVEDVVEINLHGGIATTNKVLEILLRSGCRQAEPGEFTKRAFLNGRIDLVEAEAVGDIIEAESEEARKLSVQGLTGKLSQIISSIRDRLLNLESRIEVNIDYPEYEDLEDMTTEKIGKELEKISQEIESMLKESKNGKIIKSGIDVALVGRPNVGKSSILNTFLEEEKAIVTSIAGTTRDIVEGRTILNGIMINFIDTAGIRETDDVVEKIGVDKSMQIIEKADLIILVLNNNELLSDEDKELLKYVSTKKNIIFVNKNDLDKKIDIEGENVIYGNTVDKNGLESLKNAIKSIFQLDDLGKKDFTYISNARQLSLINRAYEYIKSAEDAVSMEIPVDIIENDLANARKTLGEVLGEVYDEELIDTLFANFCLGK